MQLKTIAAMAAFLISLSPVQAQQNKNFKAGQVPKGWHLLDSQKDGYYGISLDKAYDFLQSKNLKSKQVIVAVIDSGVDTLHEDLKDVLWHNPKEIPGNGIDDDHNGYVDDVYGWNFLGGKDGRNVERDSYEGARVYHGLKAKYERQKIDVSALSPQEKDEYTMWLKARKKVIGDEGEEVVDLVMLRRAFDVSKKSDSILRQGMGKDEFTGQDLETFEPTTQLEKSAKASLLYLFKANNMMETSNKEFIEGFQDFVNAEEGKAEAKEKAPPAYRADIVGDNENDITDSIYGNNNVMVSTKASEHGTHVSGIIAASRKNGVGMDGIADNVRIMMVRAVPDGDEHDKDIALAIRYAVNNGAKIINMSFGKDFSPGKKWIDDAVRYAEGKGVLLVHAAGNDHKNIDTLDNFPNRHFLNSDQSATNWVTVGASSIGDPKDDGLIANFSNYGKNDVDIFAPGTKIYATFPGGNVYRSLDGTSMASPVAAGTAALILSYFPYLTPEQLKYCLEKSTQHPDFKVKKPGSDQLVDFSDISRTGGVISAYEALKVASTIEPERPAETPRKKKKNVKPTLKNRKD